MKKYLGMILVVLNTVFACIQKSIFSIICLGLIGFVEAFGFAVAQYILEDKNNEID